MSAVWVVRDALDEVQAAFPTERAAVRWTHRWIGDGLLQVTRETLLTPAQAAVIAAAKNWAANQRGWLKPLDETLAQAVDTLRAQEGA